MEPKKSPETMSPETLHQPFSQFLVIQVTLMATMKKIHQQIKMSLFKTAERFLTVAKNRNEFTAMYYH